MPRYYFHLRDDVALMDEEGKVLPDLKAARANAIREARAIIAAMVVEGRIDLSHRIEIADETRAIVAIVGFTEAVTVEGWGPGPPS